MDSFKIIFQLRYTNTVIQKREIQTHPEQIYLLALIDNTKKKAINNDFTIVKIIIQESKVKILEKQRTSNIASAIIRNQC